MGHLQLGDLPRTYHWQDVISLYEYAPDAPDLAAATLEAAQKGLELASREPGVKFTVWLMTQVTLAAKEKDFAEALKKLGIDVPTRPGLFDITGGLTTRIDAYVDSTAARTDTSEMCQMAAVETLSRHCMEQGRSLFGSGPEEVQDAVKELSTKTNFARFSRDFFSRFIYRYINYFLSRETSKHVGPGGSLPNIDAHTAFNEALKLHCRESAKIVQDFAGGWYSKTNYEYGITPEKAGNFAHVALKKLASELKREREKS